ncbi:MAG: LptA/OstA family protein [Gammaproteobacteria bacterium]
MALLLLPWLTIAAEDDDLLPIVLDAESSSFDQKNDTVVFRGLQITQGELGIRADEAVASALDFERSEWGFSGNVRITVESAKLEADTALLVFKDHALLTAELTGRPARFEDLSPTRRQPISGSANRLIFDNVERVLRLSEGARLSEGSNEMTGCDLIYDLEQQQITSGSSECGEQVVITIVPPSGDAETESAPLP